MHKYASGWVTLYILISHWCIMSGWAAVRAGTERLGTVICCAEEHGMFMVWLVWGSGCHSLAFQAFENNRVRFSLFLCLFVVNWRWICRLMSLTGCHGAWPGALTRQVSGLCWIMQQGLARTAHCHILALNQGRKDWRGLSEGLSNPSVGPMMEESRLSFK